MIPVEPTEGLPGRRVEYAKEQSEYLTLPTMLEDGREGRVTSCWSLDEDERKAVAEGAHINLTMLTYGGPLQPVIMVVEGVQPVAEREAECNHRDRDGSSLLIPHPVNRVDAILEEQCGRCGLIMQVSSGES